MVEGAGSEGDGEAHVVDQGHIDVSFRGGIAELWKRHPPELLLEGPAGTGKSFGVCHYLNWLAEKYPGCRILMMRKFRESLTTSVCVTFEEKVLGEWHPAVGAHIKNRREYRYSNGSVIVLGGMGNEQQTRRLFSTEYDVIFVNEATEIMEHEAESLHRALRNHVIPFQQLIMDCNPADEHHWLNRRCDRGKCERVVTRHQDNPEYFDEDSREWTDRGVKYLERLSTHMSGFQRKRLFLGLWVTAEGVIWEKFRPHVHVVSAPLAPILWCFSAQDWGFRAPGVAGLWGVDKMRRMYLLEEYYQTKKDIEWWAKVHARWDAEYKLRTIVCDPAEPDSIEFLNKRIRDVEGNGKAMGANNDVRAGLNAVSERMSSAWCQHGPGIYFLASSLQKADPLLRYAAIRTTAEIPAYCWREVKDGQPVREEPAPDSVDHGCDMTRYASMFLDWSIWEPDDADLEEDEPGTAGFELEHADVWARIKRGEFL